jgi:cellulose synthase/poly-beta-1,6-N-acetylglucosamine synthase-like glycosyltransferase
MTTLIRRAVVVVPAHNESRRIGRCLNALKAAARCATVPVDLLVVCDACQDGTAQQCAVAGMPSIRVEAGCVGVARRVGIAALLEGDEHPRSTWVANTDADSVVPMTWLRDQISLAESGIDAVAGMISLEGRQRPGLRRAFEAQYRQRVGSVGQHRHVHGANLGVRASAYLDVGGFQPLSNHEDVRLVSSLEKGGYPIARPDWLVVETSGRLMGKCDQGFATYLSRLRHAELIDPLSLAPA